MIDSRLFYNVAPSEPFSVMSDVYDRLYAWWYDFDAKVEAELQTAIVAIGKEPTDFEDLRAHCAIMMMSPTKYGYRYDDMLLITVESEYDHNGNPRGTITRHWGPKEEAT